MSDLAELGFGPLRAAEHELLERPDLVPARIVADGRGVYRLAGARAPLGELSGRMREAPLRPVTGDWVAVADDAERAVIHHLFDRRTVLVRRAAGGEGSQVLVANADVLFVVTSANLDLNPRRIERYLAAIWDGGAEPVIVLNKIDLAEDRTGDLARLEAVAAGATVVPVSAATGEGIEVLRGHLGPGRTGGFVGSSGVGKSTLINRLLGEAVQATRAVRADDDRGRHATTRRELFVLPGGGCLLDTPGLRELGLSGGSLDAPFPEIAALSEGCRFRDCTHDAEPGCAVRAAAESGALPPARLAAYHKLAREIAAAERRRDPAEGDTKRRWKSIHKAMRARSKLDPKRQK